MRRLLTGNPQKRNFGNVSNENQDPFHCTALKDLSEGRLFYEKQGEGLGEYFFDSLFSDIDALMLYGGIHPKFIGYHRMLSKRFPYAIYYRLEVKAVIVVYRVLDLRRDPKRIEQSLESGG